MRATGGCVAGIGEMVTGEGNEEVTGEAMNMVVTDEVSERVTGLDVPVTEVEEAGAAVPGSTGWLWTRVVAVPSPPGW